jgi:hypothetical protein
MRKKTCWGTGGRPAAPVGFHAKTQTKVPPGRHAFVLSHDPVQKVCNSLDRIMLHGALTITRFL